MLELVREGIIDVVQNSSFEDIAISKTKAEALN
jgi:chromatin segregation and condensation protein Rec8/ScpA/Scc1 (kleisin family)